MLHLQGEQTGKDESGAMGAMKTTYLCGPCAVACHPLIVDSVLPVRPIVDLSRGKIPLSLKDRVLEEGVNALEWVVVKKCKWLQTWIPIN